MKRVPQQRSTRDDLGMGVIDDVSRRAQEGAPDALGPGAQGHDLETWNAKERLGFRDGFRTLEAEAKGSDQRTLGWGGEEESGDDSGFPALRLPFLGERAVQREYGFGDLLPPPALLRLLIPFRQWGASKRKPRRHGGALSLLSGRAFTWRAKGGPPLTIKLRFCHSSY